MTDKLKSIARLIVTDEHKGQVVLNRDEAVAFAASFLNQDTLYQSRTDAEERLSSAIQVIKRLESEVESLIKINKRY